MNSHSGGLRKLGADLLLLAVAFFWGVTFVVVKDAIQTVEVFVFLSQRFGFAGGILLIFCLFRRTSFHVDVLKRGVVLGLFLFGGFAFQTVALLYTTASNTAFLTGLNVVFVPIIGAFIFTEKITRTMVGGVMLATVGLFLLCTHGTWSFNVGDLLAGICAVCVALHVIYTGKYARQSDVYWLTAVHNSS